VSRATSQIWPAGSAPASENSSARVIRWRGARRDELLAAALLAHGLQAKPLPREEFLVFSEGSLLAVVAHEHQQVGLDQGQAGVHLAGEDLFDDQDAAIRRQRP
jgi:hypothetical protein